MTENKTVILLIGPPGSGKSSIAINLEKKESFHVIGTGSLLREESRKETEGGKKIREVLEQGHFVPTELVAEVVAKEIEKSPRKKFLFDGFPRSLEQLDAFFEIINRHSVKLKGVIILEISRETSIKRLSGRRVCSKCKEIYNIYFNPPPENNRCKCGGELLTRDDDKPEVIEERLDVYEKDTFPLIDYFSKSYSNLLYFIPGEAPIDEIADKIVKETGI